MSADLSSIHAELLSAINEIDAQLDAMGDQEGATKRKLANELVTTHEDKWAPVAERLISQLRDMDSATMAGVYLGLIRKLKSEIDANANNVVTNMAENAPVVETVKLSDEEVATLQKQRSELYSNIKNVVELAKNFTGETLEMPKTRRGSKGKRGPRALSLYTWAINGQEVAEESNSPAGVAKLLGFDKAGDFTKWLREQEIEVDGETVKVDTKNPPESFEVTYDGKVVSAERVEQGDDDPDDETDEDSVTEDE